MQNLKTEKTQIRKTGLAKKCAKQKNISQLLISTTTTTSSTGQIQSHHNHLLTSWKLKKIKTIPKKQNDEHLKTFKNPSLESPSKTNIKQHPCKIKIKILSGHGSRPFHRNEKKISTSIETFKRNLIKDRSGFEPPQKLLRSRKKTKNRSDIFAPLFCTTPLNLQSHLFLREIVIFSRRERQSSCVSLFHQC